MIPHCVNGNDCVDIRGEVWAMVGTPMAPPHTTQEYNYITLQYRNVHVTVTVYIGVSGAEDTYPTTQHNY